jgi:hypothetical protein
MPDEVTSELILRQRLSDWGPRYTETPGGDYPFSTLIAEPWNTITASLFIGIAIYWLVRLRGRYRQFPFLLCCLPLLLTGGIGGTLFHALRATPVFFLMDVVPIYILGAIVSIYLWIQVGPRIHYLIGMIAVLGLLQLLGNWQLPTQWAVNISYASLALIVIIPLAIVLWKTRFRHAGWIYTALGCFVLAWICRISDYVSPIPIGTHWLWHLFGSMTTFALSEYFYRIERGGSGVRSQRSERGKSGC